MIDCAGTAPSGSRRDSAAACTDALDLAEEEEEEGPTDGPPWWERFPDFVPLSALKWGTNPRWVPTNPSAPMNGTNPSAKTSSCDP